MRTELYSTRTRSSLKYVRDGSKRTLNKMGFLTLYMNLATLFMKVNVLIVMIVHLFIFK